MQEDTDGTRTHGDTHGHTHGHTHRDKHGDTHGDTHRDTHGDTHRDTHGANKAGGVTARTGPVPSFPDDALCIPLEPLGQGGHAASERDF